MSCLLKIADFNLPHLYLALPLGVMSCEFCQDLQHQKTRVPGLSCGVVCVILCLTIAVEHRLVTDGQTDTHDYGIYHASLASHGKSCVQVSDHPKI